MRNIIIDNWENITELLKEDMQISELSFNTWIKPLEVIAVKENVVYIKTPSNEHRAFVNKKYLQSLKACIDKLDEEYDVKLVLDESEMKRLETQKSRCITENYEIYENVLGKWDDIIQAIMDCGKLSKDEYETWFQSLEIEKIEYDNSAFCIYLRSFCESACEYLDIAYGDSIISKLREYVDDTDWKVCFIWHDDEDNNNGRPEEVLDHMLNEEGLLQSGVNHYITECNKYMDEINSLFSEEHLLEKDKLANREVVKQFKAAKDVLDLFLGRNTGLTLSSIGEYGKDLHITFDSEDFRKIEEDVHSSCVFLDACVSEIDKSIGVLEAGIYGEDILYSRLKILGNKVRMLRNVKYVVDDDFSVEHDLIIISPVGIFTVEIKNWKSDSVVDENGFLISDDRKINLVEQVMRHTHNLEQILEKKLGKPYNVYPIVAWVNLNAKIKNQFSRLQVCNYNNVEFELFNTEKYNDNYDGNDMAIIYQCLYENALPCDTYAYGFTREELLETVAKTVAGVKWLSVACQVEEQMEIVRKNDLEYRTVDNVVFSSRDEARLAKQELPCIIKFFREIPAPTKEDGQTLRYKAMLDEKKLEFDTVFCSEKLKEKYIRHFDALQQMFYWEFREGFWKPKGEKESAQIKALRYVKNGKITTGRELMNRSAGLLNYLPEIGLEQSEAKEAFEYLRKIQRKLKRKGKL